MRVSELAKNLELDVPTLLKRIKELGLTARNPSSQLTDAAVERIRKTLSAPRTTKSGAADATGFSSRRRASGSATRAGKRRDPPIVAFGSLKGGVGKTTLALCTAELLRSPEGHSGWTWPVILIDADVAGTEVHWVWNETCSLDSDGKPLRGHPLYSEQRTTSLLELLDDNPGENKALTSLVRRARELVGEEPLHAERGELNRGLVVPTFVVGTEMLPQSLLWKDVLEQTGTYVRERLADVVRQLHAVGCAVVVDLPAFDVGFAHQAAEGIRDAKGTVFHVTDCDVRSLRATQNFLRARGARSEDDPALWEHVVVNRAPDETWRDHFWTSLVSASGDRTALYKAPSHDQETVPKSKNPKGKKSENPRVKRSENGRQHEKDKSRRKPIISVNAGGIAEATLPNPTPRALPRELMQRIQAHARHQLDDDGKRRLRLDLDRDHKDPGGAK